MPGEIVTLDPDNREHVHAAADLHSRLLAQSPIPRLGFPFMTGFFYSQLVKDDLVRCLLYRVGAQYVGFLSFTEKPFSFMTEGQRRHVFRLGLILAAAVAVQPRRVRILIDALTAGRREAPADAAHVGEFLSFGVLREFTAVRERDRGRRIPTILFDEGIRHFRERGFRRIEWNVAGDNLGAMALYRSFGATIEKSPRAWPSDYRVRLDL